MREIRKSYKNVEVHLFKTRSLRIWRKCRDCIKLKLRKYIGREAYQTGA
jgi:hypothetical protein